METNFLSTAIKHLDDPDAIQRILTEYEQNGTLSKCLDAKDNHGDALVHFVARAHSLPVLQLLRQYNADLEAVNEHGRQPIHEAIDSLECVTFLAQVCKVNVDALKRGDWTPLMIAALKGRLDIIQELDRAGCRLDLANKDGRTALHLAAQNGHVLACKYLAERCPESILKKTRSGRLPIQISAAYTDDPKAALDMTRMLFSLAKVPTQQLLQHRDNSGRSVLQDAAMSRNMELLRYIVDCGGNPNDPDALGRNVIHHLAMLGHLDVLRTLDSLVPCDWDTPDAWDEWTPLMHAARQGHLAVTKFLVETGRADPAKQDKHGRSSKQLAETWRHGAIVEYLESL